MSETNGTKSHCKAPGCGRDVNCRGLCGSCYQTAKKMVDAEEVTWEMLEGMGLCLPPSRVRGNVSPVRAAFLAALAKEKAKKEEEEKVEKGNKPGKGGKK